MHSQRAMFLSDSKDSVQAMSNDVVWDLLQMATLLCVLAQYPYDEHVGLCIWHSNMVLCHKALSDRNLQAQGGVEQACLLSQKALAHQHWA